MEISVRDGAKNKAAVFPRCADEIASPPLHITINQVVAGLAANGVSPSPGTGMTDVIVGKLSFEEWLHLRLQYPTLS